MSLALVAVITMLVLVSSPVFAQDGAERQKPTTQLGVSLPGWGGTHFNDEGVLQSVSGFNWTLGYSSRHYFNGLTAGQFNPYWGWGSIAILIPYVEIGTTYAIAMNEAQTSLFNIDIGLLYIIPYVGFSMMY